MPLARGGQDAFPPRRQVEIVWRLWRGEDLELLSRTRGGRGRALPVAGPIPLRGTSGVKKRPQGGRGLTIMRRRQTPLPFVDVLILRAGFPFEIGY
jgi:hypothetical protein